MARRRRRINWGNVAAYVILSFWMVFTLFPVAWLLLSSVKEPPEVFAMPPQWIFTPTLHNYEVALGLTIPTELETVTETHGRHRPEPVPEVPAQHGRRRDRHDGAGAVARLGGRLRADPLLSRASGTAC